VASAVVLYTFMFMKSIGLPSVIVLSVAQRSWVIWGTSVTVEFGGPCLCRFVFYEGY